MRIFSGIQPTGRKHLGNYIGAIAQYVAGQERGEAIYCIVDLHAITVAYDPRELRERAVRHGRAPARRGPRPRALHPVPPERRARAHRADVAAVQRDRARATCSACTSSATSRAAQRELVSAGLLFYPVLHGRRRARLPRARGARRRGPARAPRADARRGAALQRALRRRRGGARRARAPHPRGRRADHGPAGPHPQDVDHRRRASRAPCTCSTSRRAIEKKLKSAVTDSGQRGAPRARQAGRQQPDRDPRRRARHRARGVEAELADAALRRAEGARSPPPSSTTWRPCASATRICAPTRPRSRRSSPTGRERARAIAAPTLADVREHMGVGAPKP